MIPRLHARPDLLGPGSRVDGKYVIEQRLGGGGMADVYRARRLSGGGLVALKVQHAAADEDARRRFLREARVTARLQHENVVRLLEVGEIDRGEARTYYLAFELLEGRSLAELLAERGPMRAADVVRYGVEIARGLRAAHEAGIVHRDLKPDNVMVLDPGGAERVKLIDFGVGHHLGRPGDEEITQKGTLVGTPEYMAPDFLLGGEIGPAADLYALGVLLFELVTGVPPFRGRNPGQVMILHTTAPVPRLADERPDHDAPAELEALVRDLLAKSPAQRPPSASAVLARLAPLLEDDDVARPSMVGLVVFEVGAFLCAHAADAKGETWVANHKALGIDARIEWLPLGVDPTQAARALAGADHPALPRPLDVGLARTPESGSPRPYVALGAPRGMTLGELLSEEGRLDPQQVVELGVACASALAELHRAGLVHGSIDATALRVDPIDATLVSLDGLRLSRQEARPSRERFRRDVAALARTLTHALEGEGPPSSPSAARLRSRVVPRGAWSPSGLAELLARAEHGDVPDAEALRAELLRVVAEPAGALRVEIDEEGRLRSAALVAHAPGAPLVWVLDEPETRDGVLADALGGLDDARVERLAPAERAARARELETDRALPPWLVLFGPRAADGDPVLRALRSTGEALCLFVPGAAPLEVLTSPRWPGCDGVLLAELGAGPLGQLLAGSLDKVRARRARYDALRRLVAS